MSSLPPSVGDTVREQLSRMAGLGSAMVAGATSIANSVQAVQVPPVVIEPPGNLGEGDVFPVRRPAVVERLSLDTELPDAPPDAPHVRVDAPDWDNAPNRPNIREPNYNFGPRPGDLDATRPAKSYTLTPVTLPDSPMLRDIDIPRLLDIEIPVFDAREIPEFQGVRPVADFSTYVEPLNFTPVQYGSALLEQTKTNLSRMQQGGTGLPAAIEQALFARGFDREDGNTARIIDEAMTDFARRGFDLPPGALSARVAEARQNAAALRANANRDVTIQMHTVEIENLRFSVTQGIALEQVLISEHIQMQGLILQAARAAVDVSIAILDAQIRAFNSEQLGYQTDASVYRELINAEAQRVQVYRTQVEAELAKGQLNTQSVELYSAQIRAVNLLVDRYVTQVNAARAVTEINRAKIDEFRAEIDAYQSEIQAYVAEWQGYGESVRAKGVEASVFETAYRAYQSEVQAWAAQQQAKGSFKQVEIEARRLELLAWDKKIEQFKAELDLARTRITAEATEHEGNTRLYAAEAQVEQAVQEASLREYQVETERNRAQEALNQDYIRLTLAEMQENVRLTIAKLDTAARVYTQLGASALAGVNASAGISASQGYDLNFSWSGETPNRSP